MTKHTYALQWTANVLHMDPWHTTDGGGNGRDRQYRNHSLTRMLKLGLDLDITKE